PTDIPTRSTLPAPSLDCGQSKAVPYRGSSVVLAYNSDKVANPPQTYDDLLTWIKANPGKFAYNEPSTGGSGDAFVIAMLYKYSEYQKYVKQPFSASNEKDWDAAFTSLKDRAPSLHSKRGYPQGTASTAESLN